MSVRYGLPESRMPRKSTSAFDATNAWTEVCSAEQALSINFDTLCGQHSGADASPIDDFYMYVTNLIPVGTLAQLMTNPALGHTLLLGLVSGTELYFRRVLATLTLFRSTRDGHGPTTAYRAYVTLRPVLRKALLRAAQRGVVQQDASALGHPAHS